jgi:hypothetical protein
MQQNCLNRYSSAILFARKNSKLLACSIGLCIITSIFGQAREPIAGQAKENEALKAAGKFETIFTMRQIVVGGKKTLVIDRIIKGNVDAKKLTHAQLSSWRDIDSGRLVVFMDNGVRQLNTSAISKSGKVEFFDLESKDQTCHIDSLIRELDESPHGIDARRKNSHEKNN